MLLPLGDGLYVVPALVNLFAAALPIAALAVYFMTAEERADIQRRAEGAFAVVDIPRCAAEQYPRLVLGQNDVSVFARTLPWDHAAGTLFVNEAGGCCQRLLPPA